jgi:hypothetical protein
MIAVEPPSSPQCTPRPFDLEARRLEHRSRRMGLVLDALRGRAPTHERRHGSSPAPLSDAIAEFSRRLQEDRRRLAEVRRGRT